MFLIYLFSLYNTNKPCLVLSFEYKMYCIVTSVITDKVCGFAVLRSKFAVFKVLCISHICGR